VLWQPGTDHAGIAKEIVVSNQLVAEGRRTRARRDGFVARVWKWKEESGGTIIHQLRRLGASPDWSRERFTMDPGLPPLSAGSLSSSIRERPDYRDKRLVNWDPVMHT